MLLAILIKMHHLVMEAVMELEAAECQNLEVLQLMEVINTVAVVSEEELVEESAEEWVELHQVTHITLDNKLPHIIIKKIVKELKDQLAQVEVE